MRLLPSQLDVVKEEGLMGNLAASLALNSTGYLISQKQTLCGLCAAHTMYGQCV